MMYLYDGKKLVAIECRTWDDKEDRFLYEETEESAVLHPERETYEDIDPAVRKAAQYLHVGNSPVILVHDTDWYVEEANSWENYLCGEADDYRPWIDDPDITDPYVYKTRYLRSAVCQELPLSNCGYEDDDDIIVMQISDSVLEKLRSIGVKPHRITKESFGDPPPENWEEVAEYLNGFIESQLEGMDRDSEEAADVFCRIWSQYIAGNLPDCPEPIYMLEEEED